MQEPGEVRTIERETLETGDFTVMGNDQSQLKHDEGASNSVQQLLGLMYDCSDPTNPYGELPETRQQDLVSRFKWTECRQHIPLLVVPSTTLITTRTVITGYTVYLVAERWGQAKCARQDRTNVKTQLSTKTGFDPSSEIEWRRLKRLKLREVRADECVQLYTRAIMEMLSVILLELMRCYCATAAVNTL